ncbi:uncharacterized protein [Haliotis cracherodii]|uniref:uncharacterized protein n=1 Tax=Haliotis cracherodii TaxID=6455 RepID=UPI0039EBB784
MFLADNAATFHSHLSRPLSSTADNVNGSFRDARVGNPVLPVPEWKLASQQWGRAWPFHVYGFSLLFLTVSLLSVGLVFKFYQRIRRSKIVLNTTCLLCLSGLFRILYLTVDPYGYSRNFSGVIVGVLSQIIYPFLCASFGLIQIMLLRMTKVDVGRSKLRSCTYLFASTLSYLFCIVLAEVIVFYEVKAKLLLIIDSGFFIVLSLYLCISFICNGFRLSQYASETKRVRKELGNFSTRRIQPGVRASKSSSSLRLSRPKLRITDENHMTIAIATDVDTTSSSDENGNGTKKDRRIQIKKLTTSDGVEPPQEQSDRSETEVLLSDEETPPQANSESSTGVDGLPITHPLQTFSDFQSLSDDEESRRPMIQRQTTVNCASDPDSEDDRKRIRSKRPPGASGTLENGYMADTEIVFQSPKSRSRNTRDVRDKQQSRPILEDFDSTDLERNSSTLSVNFRTKPSSISLLRIRQSKMIQRAVHITYSITFLFMFACLLQLYTVFGVYGVLNSSFVPDPWPWYTFQTLFRSTEVAIGLTSTGVVYIILSHRTARGRRKVHMARDLVSDCVV